jgi:large subunit ribosomal protein L37Ae
MATEKKKLGSAKRFGARYGIKIKYKIARVEAERKAKQKCPYCNSLAAKRVAIGIWECKKCKSKFTGKAYTVSKAKIIEEEE